MMNPRTEPDGADSGNQTAHPDTFGAWQQYAILVIDDEPGMRSFLSRALQPRCGLVETAKDCDTAMRLLEQRQFDLLLLDNSMPGKSGVDWLHDLRTAGYHNEVILITAFADLEIAIRALRAGASDFILKPFRINQILNAIARCFDRARLKRENFVLRRELVAIAEADSDGLVGDSTALREIRAVIKRLAPLPTTVLISGESGTGKELAARALHSLSPRAQRPLVPVNCAAVAPEIIESELFGHIRGAFSGAASSREGLFYYAQGGTLFLDEVSELPAAMQSKLLRVLEDKKIRPVGAEREIPVDVRVVAATNRDLARDVEEGRFRKDLFYRLNVMNLHIPPLRERVEDIAPLTAHFMRMLSGQLGVPVIPVDAALLAALSRYAWPGNARELRNVVERALILGEFSLAGLGARLPPDAEVKTEQLQDVEKQHILRVLAAANGNKSAAARRLGLSRKTLDRKCAEWNVQGTEWHV
jgi:DNA-binding NtrC family response regulator